MPLCCVEAVIRYNGQILVVKRNNPPAKGKWWLPGGRVLMGETLEKAIVRIVRQEVGIELKKVKQIAIAEDFFRKGYFDSPCHCVTVIFMATLYGNKIEVKLDSQSSAYGWMKRIPQARRNRILSVSKLPPIL